MTSLSALWTGQETVVPAALRGYRSWTISYSHRTDTHLASTGVANNWGPTLDATCLAAPITGGFDPNCPCDLCTTNIHQAPVSDCTCGIYGWYDPTDTRLVTADVFGAIEVSGRVILGTHGFRAQHAKILALAIEPPTSAMVLARLHRLQSPATSSELHQVAVWAKQHNIRVYPTRAALLEAFPPEDVSSLVTHDCDRSCAAGRDKHDDTAGRVSIAPPASRWPDRIILAMRIACLLIALACTVIDVRGALQGHPGALIALAINGALTAFWTLVLVRNWKQRRANP